MAGVTKGFCGKKMGDYAINLKSSASVSIIRLLYCVFFGFILILIFGDLEHLTLDGGMLGICAVSGISTSAFLTTWLLAVRKNAYMMLDVFLSLGSLVPILAGYFMFDERIGVLKCIGFILILISVLIMCSYSNSIKTKLSFGSVMLLTLCGLSNGITSLSQKAYVNLFPDTPVSVFNFYTYIFAFISLLLFYLIAMRGDVAEYGSGSRRRAMIIIAIMAVALSANSYFKTLSAGYLDSALLYPMNDGMALILSTAMSAMFFGERITKKSVIGISIALIAIIIMNIKI